MKRIFDMKESVTTRFPFFFLIGALMMVYGCGEQRQENIIARVNDKVLTLEMVYASLDTSKKPSDAELRQVVNRWVTNELLFQEAKRKGYDTDEELRKKLTEAYKQLSIVTLLERDVYAATEQSVTGNDVASYYQAHSAEFTLPDDLILISVAVFLRNDDAVQFRASALATEGWNTSIRRYQSDTTKGLISYSDSLYFSPSTIYPSTLWKVATILGRNEVSFPVKTSVGYVVIRLLDFYRKGTAAPLSYCENDIRQRLVMERRQQRYEEFLQQIRKKYTVQFMYSHRDTSVFGGE